MKTYPMRCKHCGALLEAKSGAWQRLLHRAQKIDCAHCHKPTARDEAEAFGICYGAFAESIEGKLMTHLAPLPEIKQADAAKIMSTSQEMLREMSGTPALCSHVMHMFRPVIMEQARGRETEIAIVEMGAQIFSAHADKSEGTSQDGGEAAVVVLGQVEDANKNCVRQWEAMIARVGPARFVVHATACGEDPVGESSPQLTGSHADVDVTRARSSGEPTETLVPSHGSTPRVPAVTH